MKVSAVVLNWNRPTDTIDCVHSLEGSGYPDLDIIVVDNASTDGSWARFQSELPHVSLLRCTANGGYASGNNAGIEFALEHGADCILIINNDVLVAPGFLAPMVAELLSDPRVGVVTCAASFQSDPARSYPTGGKISHLRGAGVGLTRRHRSRKTTVDFVSGCVLLVRRSVFEQVGLLDPSFFMYFEDVEFSRRVNSAFRMVYTPEATVVHRSGGGDRWGTQTPLYLYYMARNRFIAFRSEPAQYRIYLVLLGSAAAIAKSMAIVLRAVRSRERNEPMDQLKALWTGLAAGIRSLSAPVPALASPARPLGPARRPAD